MKIRGVPYLSRLPDVAPFVRQGNREEAAETPPEQRKRRRPGSGSNQVEAIGAPDALGQLLLPVHELGHDSVEGPGGGRHERLRRAESNPDRRFVRGAE